MPSSLTEAEVSQMSKLEQLFHNKYLNTEFLHQLISIYVKAIEFFNNEHKFMRNYFMEKMQFVLSCPEIIKILDGGGTSVDNIRETVRITQRIMGEEWPPARQEKPRIKKIQHKDDNIFDEIQIANKPKMKVENDRFQNYQQNHHQKEQHHHYYYDESKNNQKQLKIDMKMKVMREVEENMKNIKNQVNEADQKFVQNEEKIRDIGKSQDEKLKQRLEKRKKKLRKKSVEIKADVLRADGEEPEPEPVIKKQQLMEAQRELTQAVYKFTVRMTEREREREFMKNGKNQVKGRVKKLKQAQQDEILIEQPQQDDTKQLAVNMKKNKGTQQPKVSGQPQGRVKTIRRHLDSDQDNS